MKKLPIAQAAKELGISKEAVYNRIRRGSLQSVEEDGQKLVILQTKASEKKSPKTKKK